MFKIGETCWKIFKYIDDICHTFERMFFTTGNIVSSSLDEFAAIKSGLVNIFAEKYVQFKIIISLLYYLLLKRKI